MKGLERMEAVTNDWQALLSKEKWLRNEKYTTNTT